MELSKEKQDLIVAQQKAVCDALEAKADGGAELVEMLGRVVQGLMSHGQAAANQHAEDVTTFVEANPEFRTHCEAMATARAARAKAEADLAALRSRPPRP